MKTSSACWRTWRTKNTRTCDFVELNACAGGCVGGVLQVENPYIAKAKIKRMRRYVPVSKNHLSGSIPREMLWDTDLTYQPVLELGGTRSERFARYSRMEEILQPAAGPGLRQLRRAHLRGAGRRRGARAGLRGRLHRADAPPHGGGAAGTGKG